MTDSNQPQDKKHRLVIVEDDIVSAYALTMMLEEQGYTILQNIESADNIVTDFEKHMPDLVLMDIRLSGDIDGIKAASLVREKYDTPIIFISAFTDKATKEAINAMSNTSLVAKPYETEQLVSVIRKHI